MSLVRRQTVEMLAVRGPRGEEVVLTVDLAFICPAASLQIMESREERRGWRGKEDAGRL